MVTRGLATVTLLILLCVNNALSTSAPNYRILAIFPHSFRSHFEAYSPVLEELLQRGHHVTVIGHYPLKREKGIPSVNSDNSSRTQGLYKEIILETDEYIQDAVSIDALFHGKYLSRMQMYGGFWMLGLFAKNTCRKLASKEIQTFAQAMKDGTEVFDLVIAELFNTNCFLSLLTHTKAPLIAVSSSLTLPWIGDHFGLDHNPAHVPVLFLDHHQTSLSFINRVENTVIYVLDRIMHKIWINRIGREYVKEQLGVEESFESFEERASLLLINTHFSMMGGGRLPNKVVEVGGAHLGRTTGKNINDKNIEKWISESKHGVIYFSMGSMIRGHTFPEEKRLAFLKAFGRLKQRVLWKWETDSMPDQPDNVMIQKWMPQFDILCHPNVKAFIGHGGLLGTTEAVHCGVPMLVMPQYGDQHTNAKALEASGGGVILNFRDVTEESVYSSLQTLLTTKFNTQAKELSERFRDRPMPPLDTAIYWIEYVARHKGAHHMKTAAVGMPLYQYLLLDVIAFLSTIILAFMYITYKMSRFVCSKICGGKCKKENNAKSGKNKKKTN